MNDLFLLGYIENFANDRGLETNNMPRVFEVFAVSSVLRKYHQFESADIENDVLVGGGGDGGLDAISILVNGRPVRLSEDVDFFIQKLKRLDVEFVFIQAKTSSHFSSSDIGQFMYGVEQFFAKEPKVIFNNEVTNIKEVTDYIYRNSIYMDQNPTCFLYYITSGSWQSVPDLEGRLEAGRLALENTNLFERVSVKPVDASLLKATYRELERRVVKNVEFSKTAVFPKVNDVDEAYISLLSGDQFIDLVSRDDGELNRELFYDNVRDFQGENPVNKEIHQTLSSAHHRNSFPLLNNGITIKEISQYSLSIVECLHDPVRLRKECEKAVVKIRKCLENLKDSGDPPHRLRVFTNLLLQVNGDRRNTRGQAIKESRRSGVSVEKMEGTIKWYDEWKRFGAIDEQNGDIVTFDEREIQEIPLRLRKPGTKVRYQTEEGRFGQVACNVVLKITVKSPHLGGSKRRPDYHSS